MPAQINDEDQLNQRVMELLPSQFQKFLERKISSLRHQAAGEAAKHVFAMSGQPKSGSMSMSYAEVCRHQENEAEQHRTNAFQSLGRSDGIQRMKAQLFGALGVKSENRTIAEYCKAVDALVLAAAEQVDDEVDVAMLDVLNFSPVDPGYAQVRAKAVKLTAVKQGMYEVLDVLKGLPQRLQEGLKAGEQFEV